MSDIYSILNINSGIIQDFHLLADRVADHQIEKVINKNVRALKQIEERMFVDKGLNIAQQSIDEIISKVIHMAPSGDTSMNNWTIRELRIVSYYLMKLRDDNVCYLYALELLDKNWKNMFFNGLVFYLLNSWHGIESDYRDLTSQLLVRKLNSYSESNRRYGLWRNRANLFDSNGPVRMAALLKAKNMSMAEAPSLLGFKNTSIKQAYYSDVIIKYLETNHITNLDSIEQVFELHNLDRTKKLIFAYLVETEDRIGDGLRRAQLCRFANVKLGDVTLASSWAPFTGATTAEVQRLKRAMQLVNMWFAQQIIESFFEICVQDKDRKLFWLNYVDKISGFKIVGSTAIKRTLQSNSKIGSMFLRHFIETNSYSSQTSALVLFVKNKMMVEFSDTGALYVYNQTHPMVKTVINAPRNGIASTNDLKMPTMDNLVEKDYWGNYSVYNEQGRMSHAGYWQQRLKGWLNQMLLSAENNSVSFLDQKHDDVFKTTPLPAENFKPQRSAEPVTTGTGKDEKKIAEKKQESFSVQPESAEFRYKIASKVLENGVRVVANAKGFYLSLGKNHYELIRPFASGQTPTGSIWLKKATMIGWYEIVHNYHGTDTRSIGFIRITNGEVTFKEDLYIAGKTKYKLY